jgi:hypothetical protein
LRFEIGGRQEGIEALYTEPGKTEAVTVRLDGGIVLQANVLFAAFGGETPRWEFVRDQEKEKLHVDYIVYAGSKKQFDFRSLQQALLVFAFRLDSASSEEALVLDASVKQQEAAQLHAEFRTSSVLTLTVPLKPAQKQDMLR